MFRCKINNIVSYYSLNISNKVYINQKLNIFFKLRYSQFHEFLNYEHHFNCPYFLQSYPKYTYILADLSINF